MEPLPVDDAEIAALLDRLRAEVEETQNGGSIAAPSWERARVEAGRLAPVSGDRPFFRRSGVLGRARMAVIAPVKILIRKLVRWYVEPIAAEQRAFNGAVLQLIDDVATWTAAGTDALRHEQNALSERVDATSAALATRIDSAERILERVSDRLDAANAALAGRMDDAERSATGLEDRLLRVERRPAAPAPRTAPSEAAPSAPTEAAFDYFAFETRMRADRDEIRRRQRQYVEDFRERRPVLDVGCGRGEFLALLREAGVDARGVDSDADMVAFCRGDGLEVDHEDALAYLKKLSDGELGGLFAAHFVEHLEPHTLVAFLALAAAKVRPGGRLVLETPNPVSLVALKHYFADLTHAQPLVPETLAFLVREAGFHDLELRYLNEPAAEERMRPVELPREPALAGAQEALDANVLRLNEVIFGPQDYAVVALR
ncbi:MAG: class I SAM-dependent methyltransferase [Gaiellaceae bacterium]